MSTKPIFTIQIKHRWARRSILIVRSGLGYIAFAALPAMLPTIGHPHFVAAAYLIAYAGALRQSPYLIPRHISLTPVQLEQRHLALSEADRIFRNVSLGLILVCLAVVFFAPLNYPELLMRVLLGIFAAFLLFSVDLPRNILRWKNA